MAEQGSSTPTPFELFGIDALLDDEERAIQRTVRDVCADHVRPHLAEWYESGQLPARELAKRLGALGLLGMHLEGTAAPGRQRPPTGSPASSSRRRTRGSAAWCRSRARSRCSPSTTSAARSRSRSGCPGWPRATPSAASASPSPTSARTQRACGRGPAATAATGCSTARRCGSPTARSRTSRSSGREPTTASVASSCRPTRPGFSAPEITRKLSLRASVTSELVLEGVRLPADAMLPGARGSGRPAVLSERGSIRHRLRRARCGARLPGDHARLREDALRLRQAARRLPADPGQARGHGARARQGHAARPAPGPAEGRRERCVPSRSASAS